MGIEGGLTIHLTPGKSHNNVIIQSTRPVQACQVFHGKSISDSLTMLPLLFNICGVAQTCAGVRACELALGRQVSSATEQLRHALVNMETLREHLWRLLLEWPLFTHTPVDKSGMAEMVMIQRDYQQALCPEANVFTLGGVEIQSDQMQLNAVLQRFADLLQHRVFLIPIAQWLAFDNEQTLAEWGASETGIAAQLINQIITAQWSDSGACQSVALPELDLPQLYQALQDINFVRQPQWHGQCCETSSLTRVQSTLLDALKENYGNGLLVRLVARLTEIAQLFQQLSGQTDDLSKSDFCLNHAESLADNQGIGQVAAARGQLVHRVKIKNDQIEYYQILAPTEWNFHPQGVVVRALASLEGDAQTIEQKARLLINSIDPCVAYKLKMTG